MQELYQLGLQRRWINPISTITGTASAFSLMHLESGRRLFRDITFLHTRQGLVES